jgi:hypothetical protein
VKKKAGLKIITGYANSYFSNPALLVMVVASQFSHTNLQFFSRMTIDITQAEVPI